MQYSKTFIDEVKAAIPNNQTLHDALDNNSPDVGTMLLEFSSVIHRLERKWCDMFRQRLKNKYATSEAALDDDAKRSAADPSSVGPA